MYLTRPRYLHQSLPSHVLGYPHPLDEANGFAALMRLEDTRRDGIERIICEGGADCYGPESNSLARACKFSCLTDRYKEGHSQ